MTISKTFIAPGRGDGDAAEAHCSPRTTWLPFHPENMAETTSSTGRLVFTRRRNLPEEAGTQRAATLEKPAARAMHANR